MYLCGAIEVHQDPHSWRNQITSPLEALDIAVLNPLVKPKWVPQIDAGGQRAMCDKLLDRGTTHGGIIQIIEQNHTIREFCLSLVRIADFIIVKLDKTFTVGTFEEIKAAQGKPIFVISDDEIPSMWLADQLGHYFEGRRLMYSHRDINSCLTVLRGINEGNVNIDNQSWIFLEYRRQPCSTSQPDSK